MIKIEKYIHPPVVRFEQATHTNFREVKWKVATRKVLYDYTSNPLPFRDGKYKFNSGFGYNEFRNKLEQCQGPKCCYCEKPVHKGQIEHFRPTKGWKQANRSKIVKPGYYWLAYKWENMLISCGECNHSGQKGNLFPINGVYRATDHTLDYTLEDNLIINPANEDPFLYISFNLDIPVGIDTRGRGNTNIDIFKLRSRGDIKSIRLDHLELYKLQKKIASMNLGSTIFTRNQILNARKHIRKAQNRKEPFAGMIVENIRKGLI